MGRRHMIGINRYSSILLVVFLFETASAYWVPASNTCSGGSVSAFARIGSTLFAGTKLSGVYKSIDNGASWVASNSGELATLQVTSLALLRDSKGDTLMFAGTYGGGVFRSNDRGESWEQVNGSRDSGTAVTLTVRCLTTIGPVVFAGGYSGVYRSMDYGATWQVSKQNIYALYDGELSPDVFSLVGSGDVLIAGNHYGIAVSSDSGTSWRSVNRTLPFDSSSYTGEKRPSLVQALFAVDSIIFAGCGDYGIYRSINRGETWASANNGLASRYINSFFMLDSMLYACTGGNYGCWCRGGFVEPPGMFVSSDKGDTWEEIDSGLLAKEVYAVCAGDGGLLAGTDYGMYGLDPDEPSWRWLDRGIPPPAEVAHMAYNGSTVFAVTSQGVFRSTDRCVSWSEGGKGFPEPLRSIHALCSDGSGFFVGHYDSCIYKWSEDDNRWVRSSDGIPSETRIISLAGCADFIFAGTYHNGIYFSSDNGTHWLVANNGIPDTTSIHSLTIYSGEVFAGTGTGQIYRTSDFGNHWSKVASGNALYNAVISIVVSDSLIVAAAERDNNGIARSWDNGDSWTIWNEGLLTHSAPGGGASGSVYRVRTLLGIGDYYLAGMYGWPVYLSSRNEKKWKSAYDGIAATCDANCLFRIDDTVYAGLSKRGVWKRALSEMEIPVPQTTLITVNRGAMQPFSLRHYNGAIHITGITICRQAVLELFSLNGRRIPLTGRTDRSGIRFPYGILSPGLYLYSFSTGDRRYRGQFVIAR